MNQTRNINTPASSFQPPASSLHHHQGQNGCTLHVFGIPGSIISHGVAKLVFIET
jgi:hypothetical protein